LQGRRLHLPPDLSRFCPCRIPRNLQIAGPPPRFDSVLPNTLHCPASRERRSQAQGSCCVPVAPAPVVADEGTASGWGMITCEAVCRRAGVLDRLWLARCARSDDARLTHNGCIRPRWRVSLPPRHRRGGGCRKAFSVIKFRHRSRLRGRRETGMVGPRTGVPPSPLFPPVISALMPISCQSPGSGSVGYWNALHRKRPPRV
jgi:hypothetical protein